MIRSRRRRFLHSPALTAALVGAVALALATPLALFAPGCQSNTGGDGAIYQQTDAESKDTTTKRQLSGSESAQFDGFETYTVHPQPEGDANAGGRDGASAQGGGPVVGDIPLLGQSFPDAQTAARSPEGSNKRGYLSAQEWAISSKLSPGGVPGSAGTRLPIDGRAQGGFVDTDGDGRPDARFAQAGRGDFCSTFSPDEELWVIGRPNVWTAPPDDDVPGCGALVCVPTAPGAQMVPVPLEHTSVHAFISGYIASVDVTQKYHNPFGAKIEAVYVFPLPENAAVNEFVMTVGDRKIRGVIRERAEAELIYNQAKSQGYTASLLTQQRPNVFTQKVANIEPGRAIDINIRYFHTLACRDGEYEFSFPMVVGPRFNPPWTGDPINAVAYGGPDSPRGTDVNYLRPEQRSGHDISLSVEIDAGARIEDIGCVSHAVRVDRPSRARAVVALSPRDSIPNRDFVLRYSVAGDETKSAFIAHRDERGGFFTLMLHPPKALERCERTPMEMIFVLDCSGSMAGEPLSQCVEAVERALTGLTAQDTFQLINFSSSASQLGREPIPATPWNIRRGIDYLHTLRGEGGTMMLEGIRASLSFPHDPKRLRFVAFLTDGFIGNESDILRETRARLGDSRIFSFGVGSAPNRFLLESLAKVGRGGVAYLTPGDSGGEVMGLFLERASRPAMSDIRIDWGSLGVSDVYPAQIPDLFVGRPVVVTGRFQGTAPTSITLVGRAGERQKRMIVEVNPREQSGDHTALAAVWARARIEELSQRAAWTPGYEPADEIRRTALAFCLMSRYTSFIAVDTLARTMGEVGYTVDVPVPVPQGTRYSTTVRE